MPATSSVDSSAFCWFWWWLWLWCCTGNLSPTAGATCSLKGPVSTFGTPLKLTAHWFSCWPTSFQSWLPGQSSRREGQIPECVPFFPRHITGHFLISWPQQPSGFSLWARILRTRGMSPKVTQLRGKAGTDLAALLFCHHPTPPQTTEAGSDFLFTQIQPFMTMLGDVSLLSRNPGNPKFQVRILFYHSLSIYIFPLNALNATHSKNILLLINNNSYNSNGLPLYLSR